MKIIKRLNTHKAYDVKLKNGNKKAYIADVEIASKKEIDEIKKKILDGEVNRRFPNAETSQYMDLLIESNLIKLFFKNVFRNLTKDKDTFYGVYVVNDRQVGYLTVKDTLSIMKEEEYHDRIGFKCKEKCNITNDYTCCKTCMYKSKCINDGTICENYLEDDCDLMIEKMED